MSSHLGSFQHKTFLSALWCIGTSILYGLATLPLGAALSQSQWNGLRQDTSHLFWHGFDNYMEYAYPDDELRPLTCKPFTRDFENQNNWEVNDPLPDYSLTVIDSLSTLAILASSSESKKQRKRALAQFQRSVENLVQLYGDGSEGPAGRGERARGFDLDSKVQLFETAIRGLGGLLSGHLFAVGELPIVDYDPDKLRNVGWTGKSAGIRWSRSFSYDGQLLRLAHDLGKRLLPAFTTSTGIPYPRINLRSGVPFYRNAPQNYDAEPPSDDFGDNYQCPAKPLATDERTETCSAGAGSLVLEFTTLSRLTGDDRFEQFAKRAFWSVWDRRAPTGLVGAGIDAETGQWVGSPTTGIGASIDSFYEYAAKSYILLSGAAPSTRRVPNTTAQTTFEPATLSEFEDSSEGFLYAWQESQKAIKRYVYNGENVVHPYYGQVNLFNAAQAATWIDSLSAFYPGTLALSGHVDEAETTHLLYTALWARYSAIPERWSTTGGDIEHGLPWWPGRPEFIESAWYLYRATQDPWYIHVGEMTLRDIKRRCWAPCGWAGIQDVRSGKQTDRMESFFLGETVKYLHLLFDPDHPLNKLNTPWVFSTEGHPLIIPTRHRIAHRPVQSADNLKRHAGDAPTCPAPKPALALTVSNTVARPDLFHAAALARLHLAPPVIQQGSALLEASELNPSITLDDLRSPNNNTFYPWTLPLELIPPNGTCAPIFQTPSFEITFPTPSTLTFNAPNQRTLNGIQMNNLAGIKLTMIQELVADMKEQVPASYRVNAINSQPIGKDEQIYITKDTISSVIGDNDPNFARVRDAVSLEIVYDLAQPAPTRAPNANPADFNKSHLSEIFQSSIKPELEQRAGEPLVKTLLEQVQQGGDSFYTTWHSILNKISAKVSPTPGNDRPGFSRHYLSAITASGAGAAPLPNVPDAPTPDPNTGAHGGSLGWSKIYSAGDLCSSPLSAEIVRTHQVLVVRRGVCSFSDKLENIPSFAPTKESLKLVVVVNYPDGRTVTEHDALQGVKQEQLDNAEFLFRPHLDRAQMTKGGVARRHPIPMVMVGGGQAMYEALEKATAVGLKRRYSMMAQGIPIRNLHVL